MKAKVFNEEKLIREKMKQQSLHYDNKVILQFIFGREGTMDCVNYSGVQRFIIIITFINHSNDRLYN